MKNEKIIFKKAIKKLSTVSRNLTKEVVHTLFKDTESSLILFVIGCQRSGTTMMMDTLEKDFNIKVYKEKSKLTTNDTIEHVRLNNIEYVKKTIDKDRLPIVALKPLVETQNINNLMDSFENSKAIFIYRNYKDVSTSNLKKFGITNGIKNLRPIFYGHVDNWRSENVSDITRSIVKKHFSEEMNPFDAAALFWFVRNSLFFELDLESNPRVVICRYEDLVADPVETFERIYNFLGHRPASQKLMKEVHTASLGKGKDVRLSPEIESLCVGLLQKLDTVNQRQKTAMSGLHPTEVRLSFDKPT